MKDYKIDEKGIYYTENSYHDDVDVHYVVELNKENTKTQLTSFLNHIKSLGAQERSREIGQLLGVVR